MSWSTSSSAAELKSLLLDIVSTVEVGDGGIVGEFIIK